MDKNQDPCVNCRVREARDASVGSRIIVPVDRAMETKKEAGISPFQVEWLCEASFDGSAVIEEGVILASNGQFAEMFGYTPEELKGINIFTLYAPQWHGRLQEIMDSGGPESCALVGLRKGGESVSIEIRFKEYGLDGRRLCLMTCRDRSCLKPVENQLVFAQEEFKAVFEASMDCISIWDRNCNCLYANRAAVNYIQMTPDEVIGKNICEILPREPEFIGYWKNQIESVFQTGRFAHVSEAMVLGFKLVHNEAVLTPIRYSDGKFAAVSIVYRDITEHKETEMRLKASQERLKRLSETSFEAILIHKDGEILDTNSKLLEMFGYTSQEASLLEGVELFAPQSRDLISKNAAMRYEGIYEALGQKKDGTHFPVEIQARESLVDGVAVRIVAMKDLTRQKEMQRQIAESEKKYRELYDSAAIPLYRTRVSDGKLLECNHMLAIMLGYDSKEECLRQHYSVKHYADPAQREQLLAKLEKEKSVAKYEIEFLRRNGAHAWAEITARINCEQGYIEGGQIDITASKVLSRIEKEILALIIQGKSNKEIAHLTHRSIRTVEDHRANIMKKMGVGNLVELVKIGQFLAYRPDE